ncbi:MAG: hypothetical protein K2M07_08340 [Muribaculaceae bacterium]|nr:hypothetical protein [Muribaculaceae bacterium]
MGTNTDDTADESKGECDYLAEGYKHRRVDFALGRDGEAGYEQANADNHHKDGQVNGSLVVGVGMIENFFHRREFERFCDAKVADVTRRVKDGFLTKGWRTVYPLPLSPRYESRRG